MSKIKDFSMCSHMEKVLMMIVNNISEMAANAIDMFEI